MNPKKASYPLQNTCNEGEALPELSQALSIYKSCDLKDK